MSASAGRRPVPGSSSWKVGGRPGGRPRDRGRARRPASRKAGFQSDPAFEAVMGEGLWVKERLVVSPCEGALRQREASPGQYVAEGDVVAQVQGPNGETVPVHTPFAGQVMGYLLPHGSPVRSREPVAWLRTE